MYFRKTILKSHIYFLMFVLFLDSGCSSTLKTRIPVTTLGDLREISVEDVKVQIGLGSPIPVDIFVSGTWPDLCAQLSNVIQNVDGYSIVISLLATPNTPGCPPDLLGVPFRIAVPLNSVELREGSYEVVVNGFRTTFDWKSNP